MRYKQSPAKYIAVADAARVIQERAGISENEARQDIISAIQDYAVQFRLWNVRDDGRHHRSDDYGHVIRPLSPDQIDWSRSLARGGEFDTPYTIEIEVKRDDIGKLWPDKSITPPDTANKSETPQRPGSPSAPEAEQSLIPKVSVQPAKKRGGGLKRGRYYGPLIKHLKWRKDTRDDVDTASLKDLREGAWNRLITDKVEDIPKSRSTFEDAIKDALRTLGVNR